MLQNLTRLKTNVDAGMFLALQRTAIAALDMVGPFTQQMRELYRRRRDLVCTALADIGVAVEPPRGGIYVWAPTPPGVPSEAFADRLLAEAGVVVGAGSSYGEFGEGYMRLSLTAPEDRLAEAMERIATLYT
jgi:LL-diaminopimelate aminotransferase